MLAEPQPDSLSKKQERLHLVGDQRSRVRLPFRLCVVPLLCLLLSCQAREMVSASCLHRASVLDVSRSCDLSRGRHHQKWWCRSWRVARFRCRWKRPATRHNGASLCLQTGTLEGSMSTVRGRNVPRG